MIKIYTKSFPFNNCTYKHCTELELSSIFQNNNTAKIISSDIHIKHHEKGADEVEIIIMYEEY